MIPLLTMRGVSAGYVEDIDILRGVNLGVAPGAITGLIGLNGAGKSTIMKTICGFLHARVGMVAFDGIDISMVAPHRVIDHGTCYIPQESSLFPYMSVHDNLRLPLDHLERRTMVRQGGTLRRASMKYSRNFRLCGSGAWRRRAISRAASRRWSNSQRPICSARDYA
jgi:ABC-type branched-subunit amino acid transport system ATPase component